MAMTLRLDPERAAALARLAQDEGRSMHQTVIRAIDEYLDRRDRTARMTALAHQAAADYPETLRRLGE